MALSLRVQEIRVAIPGERLYYEADDLCFIVSFEGRVYYLCEPV